MSSPTIETKLWRSNHTGDKLEDCTTGLIEASVQMDPNNDQTYTLDAMMEYDAYQDFFHRKEYTDAGWVVPEATVTWPNGVVRKGLLGHYLLIDPATVRGETKAYVHLRGMDNLWLLSTQGFDEDELPTKRRGLVGVSQSAFVRGVLQSMVVSEKSTDHVRYVIPDTSFTFRKTYEWPIEENKLAVVNEVLEGMGCWPLWATKRGVLTTRQLGVTMLRMQHPVRTYIANVPDQFAFAPRLLPVGGISSEVVGEIRTAPGFDDLLNTVMIINSDSKLGNIYRQKSVTNPENRRSRMHERNRKDRRHIYNKTISNTTVADAIATGILDHLSTYNEIFEFDAVLDPQPDFCREVIDLLIWDAMERQVARAKALVHRIAYRFRPSEGVMTITAGRIADAEGGLDLRAA